MCEPRLYVILREDLAFKYIQGQHVVAQFALNFPAKFKEWNNEKIVNLSVFNGISLNSIHEMLWDKFGTSHAVFHEPDLGDAITGIAIFENGEGHVAHALKHLKLATK
tara:strand:- start:25437 stop:25760 length:324 start_codon:yes stop_codon:yes gene_type:complete